MSQSGESSKAGLGEGFADDGNLEQIEWLLYQSTQGIHFMFDHAEAAKVLREAPDSADEVEFASFTNSEKVRDVLSRFFEMPSLDEKRVFLDSLHEHEEEYKLLVRSYFHLVENTILASSSVRH